MDYALGLLRDERWLQRPPHRWTEPLTATATAALLATPAWACSSTACTAGTLMVGDTNSGYDSGLGKG